MDLGILVTIFDSALRLSIPLLAACLAGLWSERSGVVDIGLEGKMLVAAFAAAAGAYAFGSAWIGLARRHRALGRLRAGPRLRLHQPARQPDRLRRRHQHAGGGPDRDRRQCLVRPGRPHAAARRRRSASATCSSATRSSSISRCWPCRSPGSCSADTRFGLRLRAVGENPAAVDTAGISVTGLRYAAVIIAGVLCGLGRRLSVGRRSRPASCPT